MARDLHATRIKRLAVRTFRDGRPTRPSMIIPLRTCPRVVAGVLISNNIRPRRRGGGVKHGARDRVNAAADDGVGGA